MSRFMVDLQEVDHRVRNHESTLGEIGNPAGDGSLVFQHGTGLLGSFGIDDMPAVDEADVVRPKGSGLSEGDIELRCLNTPPQSTQPPGQP